MAMAEKTAMRLQQVPTQRTPILLRLPQLQLSRLLMKLRWRKTVLLLLLFQRLYRVSLSTLILSVCMETVEYQFRVMLS